MGFFLIHLLGVFGLEELFQYRNFESGLRDWEACKFFDVATGIVLIHLLVVFGLEELYQYGKFESGLRD